MIQKSRRTQNKYAILLAGAIVIASSVTKAADETWFINPTFGYQWFDSDRQLDDENLLGGTDTDNNTCQNEETTPKAERLQCFSQVN